MVADLRYFNSLEHAVDSLKSQLETQKTQFLNEIDRLSREYYYADHMNAILGVYTNLDEFTDLQCDYVDQVVKSRRDNSIHRRLWVLKAHDGKILSFLVTFVEKFLVTVKFGNDQIAPILVQGNGNDLLTSSRGSDLYSITLQDIFTPNLICLMAKATSSQAWLWHRRLSHLNFNTINLLSKYDIVTGLPKLKFVKGHLCSSCELVKAKRAAPMR
ncbi:retrovirus-related pol polyprotein from transposon TNT 1-94 [Tanacetum coccineum]|uniref:Retrovirus-related pol polyprotein from transposon TNT 1-94 n=1 Tax=Tanacetum coccineum TaxID=301880 RepID=A0ABQ5DR05_9ASTR